MNALTRSEIASLDAKVVRFELNGRVIEGPANRTLIEIPDAEGIGIPRLCYKPGVDAVGNCRACMVEIAGERVLAPSCCRTPTDGMKSLLDILIAGGATGLTGWALEQALAVSADGQSVVGWGVNPSGYHEAFIANIAPVPLPAAVWLLGSALAVLGLVKNGARH